MNGLKAAEIVRGRQLHKFGGSSLADVKAWRQAADIMVNHSQPGDIMVVSAAGNTTNQLIHWLTLSQTDSAAAHQVKQRLYHYQHQLIYDLLPPELAQLPATHLLQELEQLCVVLQGSINETAYAEVVGHGEIWSARLMAALLNSMDIAADWLDARHFLRVERTAQPQIDAVSSRPLLQKLMATQSHRRVVVTGFIAANDAGETVLLGRNGSDYSATQIGVLADAQRVTLWSDVAGVYSADPRKVKDAFLLPELRLDEASELARLSAPVLHSRTLQPVAASNIDLQLRCSYQPEQGSTRIERLRTSGSGARIVTGHENVCMIELRIARDADFSLRYNTLEQFLESTQLKPLAVGIHADRRLMQLCYTAEVVNSAWDILQAMALPEDSLSLHDDLAMLALVGSGVCANRLHCDHFHQHLHDQAVEFICHAQNGLSLIAVLRTDTITDLVQGLHQTLFAARTARHCVG